MIIRRVEIFPVSFRLTESYATAYETTSEVHNVVCRIETKAGLVGWGNAAPDPYVTGETSTSVVQAIDEQLGPALLGEDATRIHYLHATLSEALPGNYAAKAGLNIALYDLLGKRAGLPLYQLLGCYRRKILTSVTIGIAPPEETVRRAVALAGRGFKALKLKGGRDWEEDVERVRRVREAVGKEMLLRLDANQGYGVEEALSLIQALEGVGIEFLEQPTRAEQLSSLQEVTARSRIPIMADETVLSSTDSFRVAAHYYADHINIKLMKAGGLTNAMRINIIAEGGEIETMAGCMDESVISIAAAAHFAVAFRNIHYADLDGHLDLDRDVARGGIVIEDGFVIPVDRPGLGLEVDL
jgi:L-alanine-DL-glutamate epimerase-like enolase superfamily enzyme